MMTKGARSSEEVIESAVEYAYYDDMVTYRELVGVLGREEARGVAYLKRTIDSDE